MWLLGDVFNILGAVLQGLLPTMIVLAVYYTLADIVLLLQCFYYRGIGAASEPVPDSANEEGAEGAEFLDEESPLFNDPPLNKNKSRQYNTAAAHESSTSPNRQPPQSRTLSSASGIDGTHLSPATPLISSYDDDAPAIRNLKPASTMQSFLFNMTALILVCAAGFFGWWLSTGSRHGRSRDNQGDYQPVEDISNPDPELEFDKLGQVFGYLCAVFYLGSRLPQLLLNHRRKSTEGISILFFLFACVGNLTYVLSILAYDPLCYGESAKGHGHGHNKHRYASCPSQAWWDKYAWYILVNLSWLIGSAGTLVLDFAIFVQFWIYKGRKPLAPAVGQR